MLSGYRYLWVIVFPSLNQSFLTINMMQDRVIRNKNVYICIFGLVAMSINPFEALMRYLISTMTLADFVSENGAHAITPACNNIDGMINIDSFLGITASLIAWWLVMPFIILCQKYLCRKLF